jgi:hypothetical protein
VGLGVGRASHGDLFWEAVWATCPGVQRLLGSGAHARSVDLTAEAVIEWDRAWTGKRLRISPVSRCKNSWRPSFRVAVCLASPKAFDMVSPDRSIVGEAKDLSLVQRERLLPAKFTDSKCRGRGSNPHDSWGVPGF